MKKLEFIYWFSYYNTDSPSVRYRGQLPLESFRQQYGVDSYFVVPGYSPGRIYLFLKAYFSALLFRKPNSLIVVQRVQSNFIYATLLKLLIKLRNKGSVYDLDDADYLETNPATIYYFARNCSTISAGSRQIQKHLSNFNQQIIHTTSPVVDLNLKKKSKNALFTIGWLGAFGGEHKQSMIDLVFPALKDISFDFKLIILGVLNIEDKEFIEKYFGEKNNIILELPLTIDWKNEADLQQRITGFDVGIATLTNSEIQLSKSGIKAKQYMNNGVPVLSTNLPENNSVVIDGFNGFLWNETSEFRDRLIQFYNMLPHQYAIFSQNARDSITDFDHRKYFSDFNKIINVSSQ
jgi:glycosyltransferase involved in cell wall biosynthesis